MKAEDIAKFYIDQGFWVLPIKSGTKHPSGKWQDKPKPDAKQIVEWIEDKRYDIAIACGHWSGNLVVIDIDDPKLYAKMGFGKNTARETIVVLTSFRKKLRKKHVYFRTSYSIKSKHFQHKGVDIDLIGEGNYVKVPPSLHHDDIFYEFELSEPEEVKVWKGDFYSSFLKMLKNLGVDIEPEKVEVDTLFEPRKEGERHFWQLRIVAWLRKCDTKKEIAWEIVEEWNATNIPPRPAEELKYQFESMWEAAGEWKHMEFDQKPGEYFSSEVVEKAKQILENKPFEAILDAVHELHVGDSLLAMQEYISGIGAKISSDKLNTWAIGTSQVGKSHLKYTVLLVSFPKDFYEVFTSCSPMSLFYYIKEYGEWSLSDMIIYIDEVEGSEQAFPIMRSLTGPTDITPRHLSVYDAEIIDLKIKGKRTVWFTSVTPIGTEQLRNRFIFLNPDESVKQEKDVHTLQYNRYWKGGKVNREKFEVIKAMSQLIVKNTKNIKVKFLFDIVWPFAHWRYLFPKFVAMCKIIVKIRHKLRECDKDGNLIASKGDVKLAIKIWEKIGPELLYKVNRSSQMILDVLPETMENGMTRAQVAKEIGRSTSFVKEQTEQLSRAGLINMDKNVGRAWVIWKAPLPEFKDIKIVNGIQKSSRIEKTPKEGNTNEKQNKSGSTPSGTFSKRGSKTDPNWLGERK